MPKTKTILSSQLRKYNKRAPGRGLVRLEGTQRKAGILEVMRFFERLNDESLAFARITRNNGGLQMTWGVYPYGVDPNFRPTQYMVQDTNFAGLMEKAMARELTEPEVEKIG